MPRGRHYYDPELQTTKLVEGEKDLSRIELFPVGQDSTARLPDEHGKWVGRKIEADGSISGFTPGDFNHDAAVRQAEEKWPGVQVYELRSEIEDSTWEGHGPSPRIWQTTMADASAPRSDIGGISEAVEALRRQDEQITPEVTDEQVQLRVLPITKPGTYVLLDDIRMLLGFWAAQYEDDKNPSAALALRDAVDAFKEPE